MKLENDTSHAFIDLSKVGRTDWRSVALTALLVKFLSFAIAMISVIAVVSANFSRHGLFHIFTSVIADLADAVAYIFGLWLACKKIIRRPFLSLISTDMTFDIRRCFLGAAVFLLSNTFSLAAISLFFSMRTGTWLIPFHHFEWPRYNDQIVESVGMSMVIPFLAFAEELVFRGWLTQTLKRYIRAPIIVVALVAVLFAAYHTQYGLREKMLMTAYSVGLSVLSLRDQRLELAIGAHSMMNVYATLQILFLTGPLPHTPIPETTLDWCALVILKGALPFAVMYGLLQRTGGWFILNSTHLVRPGDVQPIHP